MRIGCKTLRLVELVRERKGRRKMSGGREGRVHVGDGAAGGVPRMLVVATAEQSAELRPAFKRGQRHVRGNEPFALIVDERRELGALLRIERHIAMSHEED